jgi:hypothetical protein
MYNEGINIGWENSTSKMPCALSVHGHFLIIRTVRIE